MRELKLTLIEEAKRYARFTNEQWGQFSGLFLGTAAGIYAVVCYDIHPGVTDPLAKLLIDATIIPVAAGIASLVFAQTGKGVDLLTHNHTLVTVIHTNAVSCCTRMRERRPSNRFFRNGESFHEVYPNRKPTELSLRHADSADSHDVFANPSESPRNYDVSTTPEHDMTDGEAEKPGYQTGTTPPPVMFERVKL